VIPAVALLSNDYELAQDLLLENARGDGMEIGPQEEGNK
jgi:hypothetical protein